MSRLVLNSAEQALQNTPEFWGDLLDGLDQDASGRGEVVSAVRFDGVEEPAFRELEHTGRRLSELRSIEVETARPRDLIDDALQQAVSMLISVLATAAGALELSLDRIQWDGRPASAQIADLIGQLDAIIAAQQTQDWLTVADILEYDFQPVLKTWQPVFGALREAMPA
jgi:hypothetical protein